jgi:glucoamylase
LQYLITDGKTFFHEEKRDLDSKTQRICDHAPGYRCTNADPGGLYTIEKDIIGNPDAACLLQRTRVTSGKGKSLAGLKLYALCAPHLEVGGSGNNGYLIEANGQTILMAQKGARWLAMGATVPFSRCSCGYVGMSDGWTDLHDDMQMDWKFRSASDGNIALTGEIELDEHSEFTLGLAFGESEQSALASLLQSLAIPFADHLEQYEAQWTAAAAGKVALGQSSQDGGNLYNSSYSVLRTHEDKEFRGALIASVAIPWGEAKGDGDLGGYHLVWTRDMVNSATALLAAGDKEASFRALIYLAVSQDADGGFAQNFWVDGSAYWKSIQLDETAFPIMLPSDCFVKRLSKTLIR